MKWLVGCDGIGVILDDSISDAYPGSVSEAMQTAVTKILLQIPFGLAVEVDKGFLVENECVTQGIITIQSANGDASKSNTKIEGGCGSHSVGWKDKDSC